VACFFNYKYQWLAFLIIFLGALYSIVIIYAANTRATILGIAISFLVYVIYKLHLTYSGKTTRNRKKTIIISGSLIGLVLVFSLLNFNPFERVAERFYKEKDDIVNLLTMKDAEFSSPSIGPRAIIWTFAIDSLKEQPLMGYGARTRKQLLYGNDILKNFNRNIGHFHNSYIELTFAYGILGLLIVSGLVIHVIYAASQTRKSGKMPDDIFDFLILFSTYWFLVNLAESYIIYTTGYYVNALLGGIAYTFYLHNKVDNSSEAKNTFN